MRVTYSKKPILQLQPISTTYTRKPTTFFYDRFFPELIKIA